MPSDRENNQIDLMREWDSNNMTTNKKKIDDLDLMCRLHDYSYKMSDDYTQYHNGVASWARIRTHVINERIPAKVACIIFNREAIQKFPTAAHIFWQREEDFS